MIHTKVDNIHNGIDTAYIYSWLSKGYSVIYIGMTNNSCGPIGRAQGHFYASGTFRKRFLQERGIGIEKVLDMTLLSFPLPKKREYTGLESSYRESVEYLVMRELQIQRGTLVPSFDVVSWHDRVPRRTRNSEVKNLANFIVTDFIAAYPTL